MNNNASCPTSLQPTPTASNPAFLGGSGTASSDPWSTSEHWLWHAAPDGIVLINNAGQIVCSNTAMGWISGFSPQELESLPVATVLPDIGVPAPPAAMPRDGSPAAPPSMGVGHTAWLQRKDGTHLPVDVVLSQVPHTEAPLVAIFVRDLSAQRRLEERMHYQATHDPLTGLRNRQAFTHSLQESLQHAQVSGDSVVLLVMDLDNFKAINDGYGHATGDHMLLEVAQRLKSVVRNQGSLFRLGGDEFALLIPNCDAAQAHLWAEQILHAMSAPCRWGHGVLDFGCSIGIALSPLDTKDPSALLRYADMAMYRAKERGRGNFVFYDDQMGYAVTEKVLLSERLRLALGYEGIQLHYQPQIDIATGMVCGVEALLRWKDPVLGDIPPDRFIPVAESSGLILNLGQYVLDAACKQIGLWLGQGQPMRIAVNLSSHQLRQPNLVQQVRDTLARHAVPAQWLELEVTESQAMQDPEHACHLLTELAGLGVRLALDDFGTGHSSLAYLQHLPIQRLKLANDFMREGRLGLGNKLLGAIIQLGHALNMQVVAEGVETPAQREQLAALGCECYQGWLASKALTASQFETWRNQHPHYA